MVVSMNIQVSLATFTSFRSDCYAGLVSILNRLHLIHCSMKSLRQEFITKAMGCLFLFLSFCFQWAGKALHSNHSPWCSEQTVQRMYRIKYYKSF